MMSNEVTINKNSNHRGFTSSTMDPAVARHSIVSTQSSEYDSGNDWDLFMSSSAWEGEPLSGDDLNPLSYDAQVCGRLQDPKHGFRLIILSRYQYPKPI
jgi:hypothetical protein